LKSGVSIGAKIDELGENSGSYLCIGAAQIFTNTNITFQAFWKILKSTNFFIGLFVLYTCLCTTLLAQQNFLFQLLVIFYSFYTNLRKFYQHKRTYIQIEIIGKKFQLLCKI
jgi:hypothetical protein